MTDNSNRNLDSASLPLRGHLSDETLSSVLGGTLSPEHILPAVRHLAECKDCTRRRADLMVDGAQALQTDLDTEEAVDHATLATMLQGYAQGTLDAPDRELVESHLETCETCRVRAARLAARRPKRTFVMAAAAAAIVVVLSLLALRAGRRESPTATRPAVKPRPVITVARPSPAAPQTAPPVHAALPPERAASERWRRLLVDPVLAAGRLPVASISSELVPVTDALRGDPARETMHLEPAGLVVRQARPRLQWTAVEGARYVVMILRDGREVARSESLAATNWQPPRPLPRGATYTWQVEAIRGDLIAVHPAPPAPPATFHVTHADDERALDRALTEYPEDHLLRAVLLARAGLVEEANRALLRAREVGDPRASRVGPVRMQP